MTSSDVITPGDEHRDELVGLMRVAFNMSSGTLAERAAWLPVEKMRCVLDGDRIVAAAGAKDFRQWWGGRELEMSGIWGVVTLPEHRGGASRREPSRSCSRRRVRAVRRSASCTPPRSAHIEEWGTSWPER
jgi:hypothetical protein